MKHEMNLLPVHVTQKKDKNGPKRKGWLMVVGSFLGVFLLYGVLLFLDGSCQNDLTQIEELIKSKSDYQIIYTNLNSQKALLEHRLSLLAAVNAGKDMPVNALAEINQARPEGIKLSSFRFDDGLLCISGETQNNAEILEFKEKLSQVECFKVINMVNTNKKKEAVMDKNQVKEDIWDFTFDIQMVEV
ncbi:PilN domain-containing protein [Acetobacterium woodii]|uniref:Uncharacterized protein n=1 Tax=Acetobacterium woodii (strain ATCC 29683 / DSM 1030 / JCM 2381 / KCTC 1655 / WB1) TaxID=931626 RepID=H6LEU2_ACEWD|nr:PilN domain-containing protein [Acetobacterium woodii]AFA49385.1 hypothetical protein Awo_c26290 [Acetobacterium woodii DSM 1030]